jgi:hypothetical protein
MCACCGGGNGGPTDAPVDVATVQFMGELVDWDSTDANFCGVMAATFHVQGTGASAMSAPNGRFILQIPDQDQVLIDITPPSAPSQCTTGSYTLPAIAIVTKALIAAGGTWSGREFVTGREAIDPTKAQVFVHVNGTPRAVSIGAAFSDSQAMSATTWAAGDTGVNVFFRNVDPTAGSTSVTVAGGAVGTGTIPLVAGKMTAISVIAN